MAPRAKAKASERKELGNGDSPVLAVATQEQLPLSQIRTDGGTQMRAGLRDETVSDYEEKMELANGWGPFPAVDVVYDGTVHWLTDGFHRLAAAAKLFAPDFEVPVRVTPGDYNRALLDAAKANASHGLPRSNADKRRTVMRLVEVEEWRNLSDVLIAEMAAVTPRFVGAVREEMVAAGTVPAVTTRTGRDGRVMNVSKVGRPTVPKGAFAPEPAPAAVATPTHEQSVLAEDVDGEPIITFDADTGILGMRVPEEEEVVDKPAELITFVLRRGLAEKIRAAIDTRALRDHLTPGEVEDLVRSLEKGLKLGVRA